ncbi:MAG TPA: hypothetical protein VHR45_13390 [Thermoanaerobaculia bacterium]|nr:hypothetical protein [Thermoanaerobaculia bacterium]
MLHDHPSLQDLEGFLHNASRPGSAGRNACVVRHLLGECATCQGRLRSLGWVDSRLDHLLLRSGAHGAHGAHGADNARDVLGCRDFNDSPGSPGSDIATAAYDYDRAFANAERRIADLLDFLDGAPPAISPAERLLAELDRASEPERLRLAATRDRFVHPALIEALAERSRLAAAHLALHWARLAQILAHRCSRDDLESAAHLADLRARVNTQLASALAAAGQPRRLPLPSPPDHAPSLPWRLVPPELFSPNFRPTTAA